MMKSENEFSYVELWPPGEHTHKISKHNKMYAHKNEAGHDGISHSLIPAHRRQTHLCEWKASWGLIYIESSRPARAT